MRRAGCWFLFLPPYSPDPNPCMVGSCVARVFLSVLSNWSAAAMYPASLCGSCAARHDEYPLKLGSHSIDRACMRFGFTGLSLIFLSVSSPSPHVALTIPQTLSAVHRGHLRSVNRSVAEKCIDRPRHAVRHRDRDHLSLLDRQLPRQPVRSWASAPASNHDPGHGAKIQQAPDISVAHLRYASILRLSTSRVRLRREAEPGRIITRRTEVANIRCRRGNGRRGSTPTPGIVASR